MKVYYNPKENQIGIGVSYVYNMRPFYLCFVLEISTGYTDITEKWLDGWITLGDL